MDKMKETLIQGLPELGLDLPDEMRYNSPIAHKKPPPAHSCTGASMQ